MEKSNDSGKTTGIVVGVIAGICLILLCLPVCVIALLTLLGPAINEIFENIIYSL